MGVKRAGKRSICSTTKKTRYDSYFEAKYAAAAIREQTNEDHGSPYICPECGAWHLGRSDSR